MKADIALITLLAVAGGAVAQNCATVPTYTQALQLSCQGNEMNFNWPNYQNASEFYACQGQGRPLLLNCASGTYFSFVLQSCESCADFIPSQPCNTLQISKTSSCVATGATTPTAAPPVTPAPTKAPVTAAPTKAPVTAAPTKAPVTAAPTEAPATPTPGPGATDFPPAPSPVTAAPDIPTPPTAAPTPPPVEVKPPTVVIPSK